MTTERSAWDVVVSAGVAVFALGCVVAMGVLAGEVIPPLVVLPLLFGVVLVVRRSRHRIGSIAAGVLAVFAMVGNAPFLIDDFTHATAAPMLFVNSLAMFVGLLAVVVGGVASLRPSSSPGTPRAVLATGAAVIVIGAVAAGALSAGNDSDAAEGGDVTVVTEDITFVPARFTVEEGGGVLVKNRDLVRHTFTVDDQAIDLAIPSGRSRRVLIDLDPGTYDFHCKVPGHDDMKGTLVVG